MSNKPKTMQHEMNEEWVELVTENIDKLIPDEWNERINNIILPAILKLVKGMLKRTISDSAKILGEDKMAILCNMPVERDGKIILVPHYFKIDKSQLLHELALKDGEQPEAQISYLDIMNKVEGYTNVKEILNDVRNGTFLTKADLKLQNNSEQTKQIEPPKE